MKKILSVVLSVVLIFTLALSLTGCSLIGKEEEPLSLSIVLGIHRNFPALASNINSMYDNILDACQTYGSVSTVVVEGNPTLRENYDIKEPEKSISSSKARSIAKQNTATILSACQELKAETPETDTLAALKLAANSIKNASTKRKVILMFDSGLCTTGLLSQTESDVISADPKTVVEKLKSIHALPNLKGVKIIWVGLGCTSDGQQEIPDSYKYKLQELWTEILLSSGADFNPNEDFDESPLTGHEAEGLPDVTPISFPLDSLNIDLSNKDSLDSPVVFNESTVKFVGDKAEFIDKSSAEKALEPVATLLMNNPDLNIIVAGTTASAGSEEGCKALSMQRANVCKSVLVNKGASDSQITCIGLGRTKNCLRVDDTNADGTLNEELAKNNRAIFIFSVRSNTAENLRNTGLL